MKNRSFIAICLLALFCSVLAGESGILPPAVLQSAKLIRTVESQSAGHQIAFVQQATMLGSISGKVEGIGKADIGRVYVTAWTDTLFKEGYYYKGYALVDSNFTFRIDSLSAGRYYVNAWGEGYIGQYYQNTNDFSKATKVTVAEGTVTENINFRLEKPTPGTGKISGLITDTAGHPLSGATVYAHAADIEFYYGKTRTDENGRYVIEQLRSGSYIVQATADGYLTQYFGAAQDPFMPGAVNVVEPGETKSIDIVLGMAGSITGTILDQNGKPVVRAVVEAMPAFKDSMGVFPGKDMSYQQTNTDENGHYRISGLTGGSYFVQAVIYGDWSKTLVWYPGTQDFAQARPVPVKEGQETANIDFRVRQQSGVGSISGRVLDKLNQPIANAGVYLQTAYDPGFAGPILGMSATSDKEGRFVFERVPAGSYTLSCWAQIGWQSVYRWWPDAEAMENAKVVVVEEDSSITAIDFNLPLTVGHASINGYVHDKNGKPLQWAQIQVTPAAAADNQRYYAWASTDSSGYYSVSQLTAGSYLIFASYWENQNMGQQWWDHKDSLSQATPLLLAEKEQRTKVDFALTVRPIYGALVGKVTDAATGLPISHAYVEIKIDHVDMYMNMRPFWFYPRYAYTDENGQYSLEWLREGKYVLAVYCNGGFCYYPDALVSEDAKPLVVTGGEKTEANFKMKIRNDGRGIISGTVSADYGVRPMAPDGSAGNSTSSSQGYEKTAGEPLDRAVIIAKPALTIAQWPQSEMFYTALSEKDGSYKLTGLPAGDYYVKSYSPYHMAEYYNDTIDPMKAELVKVNETEPTLAIDFALAPMYYMYLKEGGAMDMRNTNSAMVYGNVTDNTGAAVVDATIYLLDEQGRAVAFTNSSSDGSYQMAGMTPGNYTLQVGKVGYTTTFNGNVRTAEMATPVNIGNSGLKVDLMLMPPTTTNVDQAETGELPKSVVLYGNYPNPFNPVTQIRFSLPQAMEVSITVHNMRGEQLVRLSQGRLQAGAHAITWNGQDQYGRPAASGLYLYRLQADGLVHNGKMLLVK
jgi:protocatechuate 3,4-dioxygenase beta subunit